MTITVKTKKPRMPKRGKKSRRKKNKIKMPIYKYNVTIPVNGDVILEINLPDAGSTAHHVIDVTGNDDFEGDDNFNKKIGSSEDLKKERTVIITQAANVDPENKSVRVNYKINGVLIVEHSNLKSEEANPMIKINITIS